MCLNKKSVPITVIYGIMGRGESLGRQMDLGKLVAVYIVGVILFSTVFWSPFMPWDRDHVAK